MNSDLSFLHGILRYSFKSFVIKSFYHLNPGAKFTDNFYIDIICDHMQMVYDGEITRIIINIPPRYLKSLIINVAFPAWVLGHNPGARVISASFTKMLSTKLSLDCKSIIQSAWYRNIFPDVCISDQQNEKDKFLTSMHGGRFATSIAGSITGEGADILIADDAENPAKIENSAYRKMVQNWFSNVFMTRLNDKKNGKIIVVMQRLHSQDLASKLWQQTNQYTNDNMKADVKAEDDASNIEGIIIAGERNNPHNLHNWHRLCLPAIAEKDMFIKTKNAVVFYPKGAMINAKRENSKTLSAIKQAMGERTFKAQYLQNPEAEGGNIFKKQWLAFYEKLPASNINTNTDASMNPHINPNMNPYAMASTIAYCGTNYSTNYGNSCLQGIFLSLDTAFKDGKLNDYTACTIWMVRNNLFYLIFASKKKLPYPQLKLQITKWMNQFKPNAILIEDKASGTPLIQELKEKYHFAILPIKVKGNKIERAIKASLMFEAGKVFLPKEEANWKQEYLQELLNFPNVKNDDLTDSTTQFLNWTYSKNFDAKIQMRHFN